MTDELKPEDYTSPPDPLSIYGEGESDGFAEVTPVEAAPLNEEQYEVLGEAPEPVADYEVVEEAGYVPAVLETFVNQDGEFVLEEAPANERRADFLPDAPAEVSATFSSTHEGGKSDDKADEPFWARLRRGLLGGNYSIDDPDFTRRLRNLNNAIEQSPKAASNFVVRGELYLNVGLYDLARDDFRQGYALASAEYDTREWGILAQTLADRALIGLARAEKRLSVMRE